MSKTITLVDLLEFMHQKKPSETAIFVDDKHVLTFHGKEFYYEFAIGDEITFFGEKYRVVTKSRSGGKHAIYLTKG